MWHKMTFIGVSLQSMLSHRKLCCKLPSSHTWLLQTQTLCLNRCFSAECFWAAETTKQQRAAEQNQNYTNAMLHNHKQMKHYHCHTKVMNRINSFSVQSIIYRTFLGHNKIVFCIFVVVFYPSMCDVSGRVELSVALIVTHDGKHQSHFVDGPFCQSVRDYETPWNTHKCS